MVAVLLIVLLHLLASNAFHSFSGVRAPQSSLCMQSRGSFPHPKSPLDQKNDLLQNIARSASLLANTALITSLMRNAGAAERSVGKIVVLGSNGKTGRLIVEKLAKSGVPVTPALRDVTKSPFISIGGSAQSAVFADVTRQETLGGVIAGASTVIFAASASTKGGNAQAVDYLGVANVAKECVRLQIPRLVVISSGAITRPQSLGFKITNLFGKIMDFKLMGEQALAKEYENSPSLSYVIIRPGGLLDGAGVGAGEVELNQGDTISGEIRREDVAECTIAAALSSTIPSRVVFEVYQRGKSGPLQGDFPPRSGYERVGQTYDEMFKGLKEGEVKI